MLNLPENTATPMSGSRHVCPARLEILEDLRVSFAYFMREHGILESDISNWVLILTEAVANAIKHGCDGHCNAQISVSWQVEQGEISLTVSDPGKGPPDELTREPCLPSDPLALSGRGLYLIRSFADHWEHWRSEDGYRLIVLKMHPYMPPVETTASLLDNTVEELTNSYENLSAFYRLGDGLARAENLLDFIQRALQDLKLTVTNTQLSLSFQPGIVETIGEEFSQESAIHPYAELGAAQKRVLRTETEYVWERAEEVANDGVLTGLGSGVCSPIQAGGSVRGIMTVSRKEANPFNSGELNTIRTFADILGIAVLNARNTVTRSREARALRELEIASEIQKTLLPLPKVQPHQRWRLTTRREGAREVAGDYVGAEQGRNGDLHLVIVDVMGKGVSASFLAGMFRTAFNISLTFQ
ncbi:MAG: ATP-binding protein, partial [Puniceicoccales bacterium]